MGWAVVVYGIMKCTWGHMIHAHDFSVQVRISAYAVFQVACLDEQSYVQNEV